ncbi:MAG: ROK family protein [Pseudomonadota bacterium]
MILGAIEAGGTKFVCATSDQHKRNINKIRISTTDPQTTLNQVVEFFQTQARELGPIDGMGIASFGPIVVDPHSDDYGKIYSTPKPNWSGINLRKEIEARLGVRTKIDSDVNGAALAEGRFGAARGFQNYCYMTVGTGIGVGVVQFWQRLLTSNHTELGHLRVPRAPGDEYPGNCPYHGDCVEGLACGPAIEDRWGMSPKEIPADHPAWEMEAHYIAAICNNLIYSVRPERIIIGGGVFEQGFLLPMVRRTLGKMLNGYALSKSEQDLETFLIPPGLVDVAPGLLGALEMASYAAAERPLAER